MEKAIQFVSSLPKSLEEQQTTMTNTNTFCRQDVDFEFYKGYLQDHLISVKKFRDEEIFAIKDITLEGILNDIVIGSQMSVHNSVLRLSGCCLDHLTPHALEFLFPFICLLR